MAVLKERLSKTYMEKVGKKGNILDREITVTIWGNPNGLHQNGVIPFFIVRKSSVSEIISETVLSHFSKDPVA